MKKRVITTIIALSFNSHLLASNDAEAIFDAKCSACHLKQKPIDKSKVVAPAAMGVMRHLKQEFPDRDKAIAFIKDYVLAPSKDKAICMPQKIKRFGLMPSQKGNITKEELEKVAGWMFDNFPNKTGTKSGAGCKANMSKKPNIKKPFLIKNKNLPHFVGLIQKNWDNPEFALDEKQKKLLSIIKKDTLQGVKKLSLEIKPLEKKIAMMSVQKEPLEKMIPLVEKVASLKANATKMHLLCIKKTQEVLTDKQLKFLTNR